MKNILFTLALFISFGQEVDDYFKSGVTKFKNEDYKGALADFNKVIELNPNSADAYYFRGRTIEKGYDNRRGRTSLSKSPKDFSRYNLNAAMDDYTKSIELQPTIQAYNARGFLRMWKNDLKGACDDYNKAAKLGSKTANFYISNGCN